MMQSTTNRQRILAINPRPQRFAYAVFEGSKRLLDYGASACSPGGDEGAVVAGRRVAALIGLFHPSAIVLRKEHSRTAPKSPGVGPIVKSIMSEARVRSLPVCLIESEEAVSVFQSHGAGTKYEIASTLAWILPELHWKLPPKRRAWEPEPRVMAVFDAVALGFAYCERKLPRVSRLEPPPTDAQTS